MRFFTLLFFFFMFQVFAQEAAKKYEFVKEYTKTEKILYQKGNIYLIKDENKNIIEDDIKYFNLIPNHKSFQAINKNGKIEYYNFNFEKIPKKEVKSTFSPNLRCGTVSNKELIIKDNNNNFIAELISDGRSINLDYKTFKIAKIPKRDIEDIYFINKKRNLKYSENNSKPLLVFVKHKNRFDVYAYKKVFQFDEVEIINDKIIKVKKDNFFGYFGITKNHHYKKLSNFDYNLAFFKDKHNRKGYIDRFGNEYFKK